MVVEIQTITQITPQPPVSILNREFDSLKGGVKEIRKMCHLVGRGDGHRGDIRRL